MATDLCSAQGRVFFFTWAKRDDESATIQLARPASPWALTRQAYLGCQPMPRGHQSHQHSRKQRGASSEQQPPEHACRHGFRAAFKGKLKLIIINGTVVV